MFCCTERAPTSTCICVQLNPPAVHLHKPPSPPMMYPMHPMAYTTQHHAASMHPSCPHALCTCPTLSAHTLAPSDVLPAPSDAACSTQTCPHPSDAPWPFSMCHCHPRCALQQKGMPLVHGVPGVPGTPLIHVMPSSTAAPHPLCPWCTSRPWHAMAGHTWSSCSSSLVG